MSILRIVKCLLTVTLGFVLTAAWAVPNAEVQITEGPNGVKRVTHEGRTFNLVFEQIMEKFAAADLADPRSGEIVFTGSSSMVGWSTLKQDMAPLPVVNHGFSTSDSAQLWWYADRAVLARHPRLIVVYIGDNDMLQDAVTPEIYIKYIRLFLGEVWQQNPKTRVVFMSSKPSVKRWSLWSKYQACNAALKALCASEPRLAYADITPTLLDANGQVRPECFLPDTLHIKPEIYGEWTKIVKPIVQRFWDTIKAEE